MIIILLRLYGDFMVEFGWNTPQLLPFIPIKCCFPVAEMQNEWLQKWAAARTQKKIISKTQMLRISCGTPCQSNNPARQTDSQAERVILSLDGLGPFLRIRKFMGNSLCCYCSNVFYNLFISHASCLFSRRVNEGTRNCIHPATM